MAQESEMFAPGWPGIPTRWTSSAKSGLGTAVSRDSRVWFTLSHGILNEIYYPRVDHACTRSGPRRVLLFNDSGPARERLRTMLELAGHLVYDAPDVDSGLELLKTVRPDVAIIDIGSPIVDCRRVAKRIREEPRARTMTLVAVGRTECRSDASGPPEDGFDFHLAESVDAERLARLVDAC